MLKFNRMAYYALKGMLAENAKNLDVIIKRLGFATIANRRLAEVLINGMAIDIKIKDPNALRTYLGGENITEMKVTLDTYESLEQYIHVSYKEGGKKLTREFYLDSLTSEQWKLFEIEYV